MKDVSIEYAHIYTNSKISEEQKLSIKILSKTNKNKNDSSLVILVDDYSFPDPTFDYNKFSEWLKTQGFVPDIIFRESQLIPLCDEVLKNMKDNELKRQIIDYIKTKKYPCSLFIAAWYLLRLGRLKHASFDKNLYAKSIINILPKSFKPFEDKALQIIKETVFSGDEKRIKYNYFEGRLIA